MNKRILIRLAILFLFIILPFTRVEAKSPLDHIHNYEITVDVREDGSCDLMYRIEWEVLDSTTDGPLTWIKVGIPNKYADEFVALTDNISKIKYYGNGGDYVRLDLDRSYKAGETLYLAFSLHQANLFELKEDGAYYEFTPGWFEDTPVDVITVKWNANNVESVEGNPELINGYYVWTNNDGGYNLRETVKLVYDENQYDYLEGNISDSEYYYTLSQKRLLTVLIIVIPIVGLIIATMLIRNSKVFRQDGYSSQRGLGANYHRMVTYTHHSSSGGGGCACACACACAGGGRAGCSRKDFYGTKLYTKDIYKAIERHK